MGNSEWDVVTTAVDKVRREEMERQVSRVKSKFRTARQVLSRAKSQWKTADEVPAKIKQIEKSLDQKEDAAICETIDGLNIHYRGVYCEMFGDDPEIPEEVLQGLVELTMTASELSEGGASLRLVTERDLDAALVGVKDAPEPEIEVDGVESEEDCEAEDDDGDAPAVETKSKAAPSTVLKAPAPAEGKVKTGRKKSELTINEKKLVLDIIDSSGSPGVSFPSVREKADLSESSQGRALRNWFAELEGCKAITPKGERRSRMYFKGCNFDALRESIKKDADK